MEKVRVRRCLCGREEDQVSISVLHDVETLLAQQDPLTACSCIGSKLNLSDEAEVSDAVDAHSGVRLAQRHSDISSGPEQVGTMLRVVGVEGGSLRGVRLIRGEVIALHSELRAGVRAVQCYNHGIVGFLALRWYYAEADLQVVQGPPIGSTHTDDLLEVVADGFVYVELCECSAPLLDCCDLQVVVVVS